MTKFSRSDFLKTVSILGISSTLAYYWLKSSEAKKFVSPQFESDHFVLVCTITGGPDVTLGLDPQTFNSSLSEQDIYLEYRTEQIINCGNLRLGPAAESLSQHYKDIAIINGINCRQDIGHEANLTYLLSGSMANELGHISAEFAKNVPRAALGILTNYNISQINQITAVSNIYDLVERLNLTKPSIALPSLPEFIIADLKQSARELENAEPALYETYTKLKHSNDLSDLCANAIAASFITHLSRTATVNLSQINDLQLDTHSAHPNNHLQEQKKAWNAVAKIFRNFKQIPYLKKSLFDYTTFVVVSEFSRLPYLNAVKGKDHNPFTNSALMAGKHINGNQILGKSQLYSSYMSKTGVSSHLALPFDKINNEYIYPENIIHSLYQILNIKNTPAEFNKFNVLPNLLRV